QTGKYGTPAGTSLAGKPADGFALSLTASVYKLRFDSPISLAVELRNVSRATKSTDLSSESVPYELTVLNRKTRNSVTVRIGSRFGAPSGYAFRPNTSLYLWLGSNFAQWFPEPGTYEVQIAIPSEDPDRPRLRSNTIVVTF